MRFIKNITDCANRPIYLTDENGKYVLDEEGKKIKISNSSCPRPIQPLNIRNESIAFRQVSKIRGNRNLR
jgi:hypothetical protein